MKPPSDPHDVAYLEAFRGAVARLTDLRGFDPTRLASLVDARDRKRLRLVADALNRFADALVTRPRSRRSARQAGARFEQQVASYLATHIHPGIERRARNGACDRGDITGLTHQGQRLVVECKDTTRWTPSEWLAEVEVERVHDGAVAGLVIAKRRGKADPAEAVVLLTLRDLTCLLTGREQA